MIATNHEEHEHGVPVCEYPGYAITSTSLETGVAGTVATGDPAAKFPGAPAISHDGQTIVYALGSSDSSGYQMTDGDLRTVKFDNGAGGTSTALAGAPPARRSGSSRMIRQRART